MSAITTLNPKAESARQAQASAINISTARSLAEILRTNLDPKETMKMLYICVIFHYHPLIILGFYQVRRILKQIKMAIQFCMKWFVRQFLLKKDLFDYIASSTSYGITYCECYLSTRLDNR